MPAKTKTPPITPRLGMRVQWESNGYVKTGIVISTPDGPWLSPEDQKACFDAPRSHVMFDGDRWNRFIVRMGSASNALYYSPRISGLREIQEVAPPSPTAKTAISEARASAAPPALAPTPTPTGTGMDTGIMPGAVLSLHGQNRVVQAIRDAIDAARATDREGALFSLDAILDRETANLNFIRAEVRPEILARMRAVCPWCARDIPYINTKNAPSTTHDGPDGGVICEAAREALVLAGCVVVGVGETTKSKGGRSGVNDER